MELDLSALSTNRCKCRRRGRRRRRQHRYDHMQCVPHRLNDISQDIATWSSMFFFLVRHACVCALLSALYDCVCWFRCHD